eukprot:761217-Hanusia_phi.AAC.2
MPYLPLPSSFCRSHLSSKTAAPDQTECLQHKFGNRRRQRDGAVDMQYEGAVDPAGAYSGSSENGDGGQENIDVEVVWI